MDFSLNQDQQLLKDSLLKYLDKEYRFEQRAAIVAGGGFSARHWRDFAELGLLGAAFSEKFGGTGGSAEDIHVIMEALGPYLVVEPFLWTVVVGGNLLMDSGSPRVAELIPKLIEGKLQLALAANEEPHWAPHRVTTQAVRRNGGFVLGGTKTAVFNGPKADQFIVSARTAGSQAEADGISLFLVDASARGVSRDDYRTLDDRLASNLKLDGVHVGANDLVGELDNGLALVESAGDRAIAAQCAEAVGSMTSLVETTAAYLRTRAQYGKKLADFQALQHRMADMYASTELARSMTYVATGSLGESARPRARRISAAKVQVGQGLRFVTQQAVQLHGGMGMSEELSVGHHFKRATLSALLFGDETYHLDRFRRLSGEPRND